MADLICTKCRRWKINICPEKSDQIVAANLANYVGVYCEAVVERRLSLAAADRFYRDLMVYQWRLNAIDVQVAAVEAVITQVKSNEACPESIVTKCREELEEQCKEAVCAFEERASHYALGAPTRSTGHIKRFAGTEAERQVAIDYYRDLARDTFGDFFSELGLISSLSGDEKMLCQYKATLEGRAQFWHAELEETWTAWHNVTARMHTFGEAAMAAWRGVVSNLKTAQQSLRVASSDGTTQHALVTFAARGLEVELVNSLGLTGLTDDCTEEEQSPETGSFSQESRITSLISVLEVLKKEGLLHLVGEALSDTMQDPYDDKVSKKVSKHGTISTPHAEAALRQTEILGKQLREDSVEDPSSPKLTKSSHSVLARATTPRSCPGTPMASAALRLAAAARLTPTSVVRLTDEDEEEEGAGRLIPWLSESIVEATRKAIDGRACQKLIKLLKLCRLLGNARLASAVYKAAVHHSGEDVPFWSKPAGADADATSQELSRLLSSLSEEALDAAEANCLLDLTGGSPA